MFKGLNVSAKGVVHGVNLRGSDYARANLTMQAYLANGNVGAFANNINGTPLATNVNGGLLAKAGLPTLKNPLPGTLSNLAQTFFTSTTFFDLDASLGKTFRITERFSFELRMDWLNSTNHPDFSKATIDSTTFGRFTGTSSTSNNNRIIVLGGRISW